MIIWMRSLTIILTGILFFVLFWPAGKTWAGISGLILNLFLLIPWGTFFTSNAESYIDLKYRTFDLCIFCDGNLIWALWAAVISLFLE